MKDDFDQKNEIDEIDEIDEGAEGAEGAKDAEGAEEPPPDSRPSTFTTDGVNITYLNNPDIPYPQYTLSHNIFDGYVHVTLSDTRKSIYEIEPTRDANRTILIHGQPAYDSFGELRLYQDHKYSSNLERISMHKPWKVVQENQSSPMLELRIGDGQGILHMLRHPFETNRRIAWYDSDNKIIAMEHRIGYSWEFRQRSMLEQAMDQSRPGYSERDEIVHTPTLEILVGLEDKMFDLLVAVWIARLVQELKYSHPTTMKIRLQGNWDTNS